MKTVSINHNIHCSFIIHLIERDDGMLQQSEMINMSRGKIFLVNMVSLFTRLQELLAAAGSVEGSPMIGAKPVKSVEE